MEDKNVPFIEQIVRHGEPNQYDEANYGAQCKVFKGEEFDLYVQTSNTEYEPKWDFVGRFPNVTKQKDIDKLTNLKL